MSTEYGLLGVIYEATLGLKPLLPMVVDNVTRRLDEFVTQLPELRARGASLIRFL